MTGAAGGVDVRRGVLLGVTSAAAFGTLGIWGKLAGQGGLSSFTTLGWRFLIVAALLLPISSRGVTGAQRARMLGVGLLYTLATTCYFGALERVSAGATSLLLYLAPAFVILLSWGLGRAPRRTQLGAVALAGVGLALVVGLPSAADRDAVGLTFAAGAGALYAGYLVASERLLSGVSALAATAHMALVSGVVFAALAAAQGTLRVPVGAAQWGPILALALLPTIVAVPALYGAIRHLGATRASLLGTLEPLVTVALAAVILREQPGPGAALGGVLILAGALLAQWPAKATPAVAPAGGDAAAGRTPRGPER
ncbi:permease of the drug/metabolite transporter (DMT) superfamily [Deinococcus grandis]|uniref:Permease of the drug/metabolite transporter (DMT) superfamily n=1 Tax=Deinococcus grandis TaxID=57498 RepID=A0A124BR50_9DEIO|nr:DMT family transporter [Deinococcus grandis]BBN96436.1 hypothetical protein DEGR_31690 [Deinococcus grandis]GAQ20087.1 permease of the drug/metabolite transporter (DMT) superfamily [Deinococcus grandis]